MKFEEYFDKICEACIVNDGLMWNSYLVPNYKHVLKNMELLPKVVDDEKITMEDVGEMLKLEVERRRAVTGKERALCNWIYEIIDGTIEPTIESGKSEMLNDLAEMMTEYLRKQKTQEDKKIPDGISFSKRDLNAMVN